jgi:O-antigen/teichoic acid export membrane protein
LGFLQLGMSESLYFFVPRSAHSAGHAVANAIVTLAISGVISGAVVVAFAGPLGRMSGVSGLQSHLPLLGVFLGLMLVSTPLEIVMVSRKEHRRASITYAVSDAVRAALLIAPAVITRNVDAVMAGAVVFAAARVAALTTYALSAFRGSLRVDRTLWAEQWKYAIPFTIAVIIEVVQINMHQYIVAARFDATMFAIYSVGCMQIPLVELLASSTCNVMMVRMAETPRTDPDRVRIWHEAVSRLALVFIPLAIALAITAHQVIALLYPASYLPAVPIFAIATALIALASFPIDGFLRVYADTRFLIVMNIIRLSVIAGGISWALSVLDLRGAILITVAAQVIAKTVALGRIQRLMRVPIGRLLPWRELAITVFAAVSAVPPALWARHAFTLHPLPEGALVASTYALVYLAVVTAARMHRWALPRLGWQSDAPGR